MKALLFALVLLLVSGSARAQCVGDCDVSNNVTVDEVVVMVNVALGLGSVGSCTPGDPDESGTITVDEILTAVSNALAGCSEGVRLTGICLRPTSSGLGACDPRTAITVSRCEDLGLCLSDPMQRTFLGATETRAGGSWDVVVSASLIASATLHFEAAITNGVIYRTIDFGPAGAGGGTGSADVVISPVSEAGVRVINGSGLESFDSFGVDAVLQAVESVTAEIDFSNLSVRQAVDMATQVAFGSERVDEEIASVIRTNGRLMPGPTISDEIEPVGDTDIYSFVLPQAAQTVLQVNNLQETIQPCVVVSRSLDGEPVPGGSGCATFSLLFELALPAGTYYVHISDRFGDNVGPYTVQLQVF